MPCFQLERFFARYEFSAPYLLCASDCEGLPLRELLELASPGTRTRFEDLVLGYTDSQGLPDLRAEAASFHPGVGPDGLVVLAPEEGIFIALQVLLEPGDHCVVTFPGYQSLYQVAAACGARVSRWEPHPEDMVFHVEDLERLLEADTRLLVMNFPHNPTGYLPPLADFERILALAEERGVRVLSDEMYRCLEYDPADRLPSAASLSPRAVSLFGLSKSFALAGLRIGWLASQDISFITDVRTYKDYTTICSSAPSEILALAALQKREVILARNLGIVRGNLALLDGFFARHSGLFRWQRPKAGTVAFPELLAGLDATDFTERLVEQQGVLLLPGAVYDHPGAHLRFGFGRKNLPQALERLEDFIHRL